ncbi:hypothetical protein BCR32DRAFT_250956 [Anaeromyces robustus]|uniref:Uncharacterized protein n=1 Tax=Anaeromyces robustus TaxID=1754192 RepID=A0A1Y1VUN2_9FUNG|nr:hypothetical protein BCR32DRAFT_250956 [Anaeromyces robustus]|eukprot:ORX64725.1 hypothetical protein BCR32DRAFT_250956 [Anaeromyces robustus]
MKKHFKKLDYNCRIKNITNESISKEGQENIKSIQEQKENIQEISNSFSKKLNKSIEAWDNLRNVCVNKSNEYCYKQYNLLNDKNEYLNKNISKINYKFSTNDKNYNFHVLLINS